MPSGADLEYARLLKATGRSSGAGLDGASLAQLELEGSGSSGSASVRGLSAKGNGVIWGLGDSITANGRTVTSNGEVFGQITVNSGAQNYLMHAVILSTGRLRYGGIAATGGFTSQQIIDNHLPTVLAARPQFCVVHAGTNDTTGLTEAQTRYNLSYIVDQLLSVGTTPILTTMLPKHTEISATAQRLQRLSLFIKRLARVNAVPCLDWRDLFADTTVDDWALAADHADDTHPSGIGARKMGQSIVDKIGPLLPDVKPWLATSNINTSALFPTINNALGLTDTNADGIPDNWATQGTVPAGSAFSLTDMAANEGRGKWFNITRPAGATDLSVIAASGTLVPGNRILLALKAKTANVLANGASFDLRFIDNPGSTIDMWGLKVWTDDLPFTVLAGEFIVPSGVTSGKLLVQLRTAACAVSVGQVTFYDLTASLGIN